MNKKVLLLTQNFPPIEGGSGRWFWELYSRLPKDNVVILTHNQQNSDATDSQLDAPVIRTPLYSPEWGFKSLTALKFYWRSIRQVRKVIKQHNIEEIHCGRVIHEGVTALVVSYLTGIPYRCFIHGEDVETAATSREQSLLVKQVCKKATNLICNSENSRQLTASLGFASADKCEVLHPGADLQRFVPAPEDKEFKQRMSWNDKFILVTVGRLQQRKGQDMLIQALPQIVKAIPNCLYVVIGSGELAPHLQDLVSQHNMQDHVQFLSGLDDESLIKCYQQSDVFILPNRTIGNDIEGFGMVLVEAQACGKSVVAGDSGGTKETMGIGETGHIIDCTEPKRLAEQLIPILQQPAKPAEHYRQFVEERFSWPLHVKKFIKMLNV